MTTEEETKKTFNWSYNVTYSDIEVKGLPSREVVVVFRNVPDEVTIHCDYLALTDNRLLIFYKEGRVCSIIPLDNILYTTNRTARGEKVEQL